ncbi:unnamed protein product [Schistocephalus solidus]|uniref:Proline-rich protein 29 n=1 Tax=Schistocephalus solidus TaxID=70667 RepID=A0A183TEY3_SCHSO|nr:unnamed protein product [Schistocephalus solidus]
MHVPLCPGAQTRALAGGRIYTLMPSLRFSLVFTMNSFPLEGQRISALASDYLTAAHLSQMAERLMKLPGIVKPPVAALSTLPVSSAFLLSQLNTELAQLAEQAISFQQPLHPAVRRHHLPGLPSLPDLVPPQPPLWMSKPATALLSAPSFLSQENA